MKTKEEVEQQFVQEINWVGVKSVAWLDAPGGYQAGCLWMADGGQRFWKVKDGRQTEFERKLNFVEELK